MHKSRMRRAVVRIGGCAAAASIIGTAGPAAAASLNSQFASVRGSRSLQTAARSRSTLRPTAGCYVNATRSVATMHFTGSNWPANAEVLVTDGTFNVTRLVKTTARGDLTVRLPAPPLVLSAPGYRSFTLTAATVKAGIDVVTTRFRVTRLMFAAHPSAASPDAVVRWSFSGFTPGRRIYGHFRHGRREAATARYGIAKGPCGTLTTRRRLFPGGHPRYHVYRYQMDDSKIYSPASRPRITGTFTVS